MANLGIATPAGTQNAENPPPDQENHGNAQDHVPDPPPVPPAARARRTHISDAIIKALKELPLSLKLERNKQIEVENLARSRQTLEFMYDPAAHPQAGSEQASMITIDSADRKLLKIPSVISSMSTVMPNFILEWLGLEDAREKSEKRKHDESLKDPSNVEEDCIAKRRCMFGASLVESNALEPTWFDFPQIMFDTERFCSIPLPFFTHQNLRYITDNTALLPTRKANPLPGESKGCYIIDVEKLSLTLGAELSLDYGHFTQAAAQMFNFQTLRAGDSQWVSWWHDHFRFFDNQPDSAESYEAWKHAELTLRRDSHSFKKRIELSEYKTAYIAAITKYENRVAARSEWSKITSEMKSLKDSLLNPRNAGSFHYTNNHSDSKPLFQNGGSKVSAPPTCILCAERGHTLFNHSKDKSPAKFPDGKPAWAKFIKGQLLSPDSKEICINFNIKGQQCHQHPSDRLHVCSFCGSKTHHALSFICRPF